MMQKKKPGKPEAVGQRMTVPHGAADSTDGPYQALEIVLKSDGAGTLEAVRSAISYIHVPAIHIKIIQDGIGPISKSDILMARTGSRLIVGFNVGVAPKLEQEVFESGVEIRLYDVIYKLSKELTELAQDLLPKAPEDKIVGTAEVIAVFKRNRGIVIGCEVKSGAMEKGKPFRVITAMGPAYAGKIESLQIEKKPVKTGRPGQQVGIGIAGWKKAKVGDLVECFEPANSLKSWRPKPGIRYSKS